MSPREQQRLDELVSGLCEGTISDVELHELERVLAADQRARRRYLEYLMLHGELNWDQGDGETIPLAGIKTNGGSRGSTASWIGRRVAQRALTFFTRPSPLSMTVAALVVGLMVSAMALIAVPIYSQLGGTREVTETLVFVAQLTAVHKTEWGDEASSASVGAHFVSGRQIVLKSGLAEITYDTGAKVILQGPCRYEVFAANAGKLNAGRLNALIPSSASGFSVQTPFAEVTDLGTEFGVEVLPGESVSVVVMQGVVEMVALANSSSRHRLGVGNAMRVDHDGSMQLQAGAAGQLAKRFARNVPKRRNVALGKTYSWSRVPGEGGVHYLDEGHVVHASQGGTGLFSAGQLTDGVIQRDAVSTEAAIAQHSLSGSPAADIIIDLGEAYLVEELTLRMFVGFANANNAPDDVRISFATDALEGPFSKVEHFEFSKGAPYGDGHHALQCDCTDTLARYVKLSFDGGSLPGNSMYDHKWMLDEVHVFGYEQIEKHE